MGYTPVIGIPVTLPLIWPSGLPLGIDLWVCPEKGKHVMGTGLQCRV
jgi:hypothetical protein